MLTRVAPVGNPDAGTLYVVGLPIGNLEDVTLRALRVLRDCEAVACEDTRRTWGLLSAHGIPRPATFFSLHEHNEERATGRVLGLLERGCDVALCSDAGMPLVSDPGYRTVRRAHESRFDVRTVPGPSAILAALSVAGLPTSSFTFKGFPPRSSGPRRRFLARDADQPHTLVLFESSHRLAALLGDALDILGDREACVCIELTKVYESAARGYLSDLRDKFRDDQPRGEVTVVITGNHEKFRRS
jgi:16S rRNA (cytidine1402-2'-O)-methyltransferase